MALVYNNNEDMAVAVFISRLQVIIPFYKHLVKNDITRMRDILVQAQKYIQIEETTLTIFSHSPREGPETKKPKPQFPLRKKSEPQLLCRPQSIKARYRIWQGK